LGYRPEEYAMFGVDMKSRGKVMEDKLSALTKALSGERFDYEGRQVQVTPTPFSGNGIPISYGGHSKAAARRAGRFGLGFMADGGDAELEDLYRESAIAAGHEPGGVYIPHDGLITSLHVAQNIDEAWDKMGTFLLHDAQMYGQWMENNKTASTSLVTSVEALRAENGPYRIVTPDEAIEMIRSGNILAMQPLCGGCPPEIAWESLRLVADVVMPAIS
jgi:alkanesulfonate monooxygenase SsuD/methylene tetrahydromethanopterin reductase-like flavin-dependent oxidoreductase (luciferase family)